MNLFKSKTFRDIFLITVGTFLMAVVTKLVYDPSGIVTGGFSGIAIIVKALSHDRIPLWLTTGVLNVPLFLAALKIKGWDFIKRTVLATVLFTFFLAVIPMVEVIDEPDLLLRAVFGGLIYGAGIGFVFYANATTGGSDTLGFLLHEKIKRYTLAQIVGMIDALIVLGGLVTFKLNVAMYSVMTVFVVSKISDMILEGAKFAKAVYIISDDYERIADAVLKKMERGVTGIGAEGMYSHSERKMLMVAVSKKQIVALKELVYAIDPKAFMIVTDAHEVLGEGFFTFK